MPESRVQLAGHGNAARWLATGSLALAMMAAAAFLAVKGRHLTFYADEWDLLTHRRGHDPATLLHPQNGHLVILPLLIYKSFFAAFGATSYAPYRIAAIATYLLCAGLFFTLVRRRVGDGVALLASVVLLFLGTAWEQSLSGIGQIIWISLGAGLGMLLALEAQSRRGDVAACLLLAVSLASFSYGLPFAVAAAVEILLQSGWRRRAWVVAAPLALYGAWTIAYGQDQLSASNLPNAPAFLADALGAVLASLTGLYRAPGQAGPTFDVTWGPPLAALFVAAVALRVRRSPVASPRLWSSMALALAFWASLAVVKSDGRTFHSSRYQYAGALFVLLVAAELVRGVRPGRGPWLGFAAAVGILLAVNITNLSDTARYLTDKARVGRSELAALELAGASAPPDFSPEPGATELLRGHFYVRIDARSYLGAVRSFGSPAYRPSELPRLPSDARAAADLVLVAALAISPRPASGPQAGHPQPVALSPSTAAARVPREGCVRLRPERGSRAPLVLTLPPGGVLLRAAQPKPVGVALRRFASDFVAPQRALPPGRLTAVPIPPDSSAWPWRARLDGVAGSVLACGLRG